MMMMMVGWRLQVCIESVRQGKRWSKGVNILNEDQGLRSGEGLMMNMTLMEGREE